MTTRCEKRAKTHTNKEMSSGSKAPDQQNDEQDYRSLAENSVDVLWTLNCHGQGFRQADTSRLFERFNRGQEAYSSGGHVKGLSAALRVVERHGGRIWAGGSSTGKSSVWFTPRNGDDQ